MMEVAWFPAIMALKMNGTWSEWEPSSPQAATTNFAIFWWRTNLAQFSISSSEFHIEKSLNSVGEKFLSNIVDRLVEKTIISLNPDGILNSEHQRFISTGWLGKG